MKAHSAYQTNILMKSQKSDLFLKRRFCVGFIHLVHVAGLGVGLGGKSVDIITRTLTMRLEVEMKFWDKASGTTGGEVQTHLFMQSSSSRRRAMRVCQPRGRIRM